MLRLLGGLAVAAVLAMALWRAQSEAAASLFQSGLEPTATPAVAPTAPAVPSVAPTMPPPATEAPTSAPTAVPLATRTPAPLPTRARATAVVPNIEAGSASSKQGGRYPTEAATLGFDWKLLLDSLALLASYVWLGCGVLLLLAVVPFFWALRRASRRRQE